MHTVILWLARTGAAVVLGLQGAAPVYFGPLGGAVDRCRPCVKVVDPSLTECLLGLVEIFSSVKAGERKESPSA